MVLDPEFAGTSCDRDGGGLQGSSMNCRGYQSLVFKLDKYDWNMRPAYPNNNEPLDEIGNKPDNSIERGFRNSRRYTSTSCPDGYREFECAGDGTSEDNGDMIPGCGTGHEWNDIWVP